LVIWDLEISKIMMKEKIKTFEERADAFLDTAWYNFQNKRYDLEVENLFNFAKKIKELLSD